jgi:gamma-glutamyl-gamma-aminobutyrate hydrolase PuuD
VKLVSAVYKEWYPFNQMFQDLRVGFHPAQLDGASALLLWGGEDISPSIYGQHRPKIGYSGPEKMSVRDETEVSLAKEAIRLNIPIIGICRGAQLMCAVSGGSLFQHVTNHAGQTHECETDRGTTIVSNSLHHQMMNLSKVDHYRIAWIEPGISHAYIGEDGPIANPLPYEPEIVYIPKTKALCIQGHPEFMDEKNPFVKYCLELVEQYILANVNVPHRC